MVLFLQDFYLPQEDFFTISCALSSPYLLQNATTAFSQNNKDVSLKLNSPYTNIHYL